jgi:hypothetical protein
MCMKASTRRLAALLFGGLTLRGLRSRHLFRRPGCCAA